MGYSPTGANRGKKYYSIFKKDVNRENHAYINFYRALAAQIGQIIANQIHFTIDCLKTRLKHTNIVLTVGFGGFRPA